MTWRRRLGAAARTATKAAAAGADVLRRPQSGLVILIYHRVGAGAGGQMDLDPSSFDAQLAWLGSNHRVLSLDDGLDELALGLPGGPAVVLSFDDGTEDWARVVLPALERHRTPATFYVSTRFVDEGREFPGGGRPLTWAQASELAASDLVTIGSHTHSHALLDRLPEAEVADELDRSVALLRERLDVDPRHFCYPKALLGSPEAERLVRERFDSAVLAGTRANTPGTDPFRLRRSPVQAADGMHWFSRKVAGGMAVEDTLRDALNRIRYRGAQQ